MKKLTIVKSKFAKWLKKSMATSNIYYKCDDFIASEMVSINLKLIENLDDIKPTIVAAFSHLEGEWIYNHKDKQVYDYEMLNHTLKFDCMINSTHSLMQYSLINPAMLLTHAGNMIFDNLTVVPEHELLVDKPCDIYQDKHSRKVVMCGTERDTTFIPCVILKHTLKLTNKDFSAVFLANLIGEYHE